MLGSRMHAAQHVELHEVCAAGLLAAAIQTFACRQLAASAANVMSLSVYMLAFEIGHT
jgi:hypothetical protein